MLRWSYSRTWLRWCHHPQDRRYYSVQSNTVYLYFKDKNEILFELHDRFQENARVQSRHLWNSQSTSSLTQTRKITFLRSWIPEYYDLMFIQRHQWSVFTIWIIAAGKVATPLSITSKLFFKNASIKMIKPWYKCNGNGHLGYSAWTCITCDTTTIRKLYDERCHSGNDQIIELMMNVLDRND